MKRFFLVSAIALTAAGTAQAQRAPSAPPSWAASATALTPAGFVAGEAYATDTTAMIGRVAVYPAGADDPKTPASSFTPRQALEAKLGQADGQLTTLSVTLQPRTDVTRGNQDTTTTDPDKIEREYVELNKELEATRAKLPPGTEPCDIGAWSNDMDKAGLNVRAEPSSKARVLGTLPPPVRLKNEADMPDEGYHTEFRIRGYKDGWFLIDSAEPPGQRYVDKYPKHLPKPYAGRGWVHASKVGAQYANGDTRMGGLFQAPHADAKWTPAKGHSDHPIGPDGGPKRILACSGFWALVDSHDNMRGWWRRLCNSQVTNCS